MLPTIEYVHNINESSCGMIGNLEHFWYCGCWFCWCICCWYYCCHCCFCKHIHMILLFVKCCSCAIRLVKQPKKAGTSQVVFLIELLGFPGGKEGEKRDKERERNRAQKILNQITAIKHIHLRLWKWSGVCNTHCLHWCLRGSLSNQLVFMQLK